MKAIRTAFVVFQLFGAVSIVAGTADQVAGTNNSAATNVNHPAASVPDNSVDGLKVMAEKGDARAQYHLGLSYFLGQGVQTNYVESAKWFLKAAEQGYADAEFNLAVLYSKGLGVARDESEALKWRLKVAEQGDIHAQGLVGYAYEKGDGVIKDSVEAARWYRRAAEQGDIGAQITLGGFYENGTGVPKNNVEAYKWYNLASAHSGNGEIQGKLIRDAAKFRDFMVLSGEISPEEVAEAQRLSVEFAPRKETPGSSSSSPVAIDSPLASGTGFFITEDGYLVSNYHVVKDAVKIRLKNAAGTADAKVVQVDAANDLALLKAEERSVPLPITPSRSVQLGNTVATVGFPNIGLQGSSPKLSKGEIAALAGAGDDVRYFQVSLPVQPGNSGGALVDERGNVVGIVSAKLNAAAALESSGALPENVNYAVKSGFLLSFLESVPDVAKKLKEPNTKDEKFEDVVKSAQAATVLILVY